MGVTRLAAIGAAALAILSMVAAPAHAGDASAAKRNLNFAKMSAESERWDDMDGSFKKATAAMEGLSDAEKAPLLAAINEIKAMVTKSVEEDVTKRLDRAATSAEPGMQKLDIQRSNMRLDSDEAKAYADPAVLQKLRARIASMTGAAAPKTPDTTTTTTPPRTNTTTGQPALTGDLATAATRLRIAHSMLEQGDRNIAESLVRQAIKLMETSPEADRAPLMADAADLSKKIDEADMKAQRDEEFRRINEQVNRYVGTAENSIQDGVVCDTEWIDKSETLLAGGDAKTYMTADQIKVYQDRLDATRIKLKAHNKAVALDRCQANLKELEARVATDPFKGQDDRGAYDVYRGIESLSFRVLNEFAHVPKDDPEIKAVIDRVAAANAKVETASGKWAIDKMQEQFTASWKFGSQNFTGWEAEKLSPDAITQRRVQGLDKTTQAVSGTVYWLNQPDTKQVAEKYKDNAIVAGIMQTARKTLDDASARLNEGYNAVVAEIERQPMPQRESDRMQIVFLGHDAEHWFAGTKYLDANVARAKALEEKWKAEVARIEKERAETLKRMTAEASAAWPRIEASVAIESGFTPDAAERFKGKTIKIKGYYNRTGWDFDSKYDYAVGIKGIPVAGTYAPNVMEAFNDVQQKSHWGIDDHTGWDLIAVVEGAGTINRRVITEWKDANTRQVIMKTESLVPEPCVLIKIIGLHTGPLAVGPK